MPELPSGTVTFLFTDLEGSTRLWEEHPEAMRAALARHDEILRDAIEKHGGVVFVERWVTGCPRRSRRRATRWRRRSTTQLGSSGRVEWGAAGPLRARMGLHTGEAELRRGRLVRQPAVNRAARLMAVAHGGQVVVSDR